MTFAEAFQASSTNTARVIEAEKICQILNLAQEVIWRAYPWRWTISELDPFWVIPLTQDYGPPIIAVPSDFLEIQGANIVRINNLISARTPLQVQRGIPKTAYVNRPNTIAYIPETRSFRLHPKPPSSMASPEYLIEGFYKKTPTIITPSNYQVTNLPSQDHQRQMWQDAISWAYASVTKDQNADRLYQRTQGSIAETAAAETIALGNPNIHPYEGIVSGGNASGIPPIVVAW